MAEAGVVIKMTSDEARYLAALRAAAQGLAGLEGATKKATEESRKLAREEDELGRKAKQVWEQTRTPLERYNQKLAETGTLLQRGKIDQETYNRAAADARKELDSVAKSATAAFGPQMAKNLTTMVAGLVGFTGAAGTLKQIIEEMRKISTEAAQKARESQMNLGELAQLAITPEGKVDPEKYRQLVAEAKQHYAEGGAATLSHGAATIFALQSAGAMAERKLFSDLYRSGTVGNPAEMARAAATMQTSMGEQAGDFKTIVSRGMAASIPTPARAEDLLVASARAGGNVRALGLTSEELLAAVAIMSAETGEAKLGGTTVTSLTRALRRMRSGMAGDEGIDEAETIGPSVTISEALGGRDVGFDFAGKNLMEILEQISTVRERERLTDADVAKLFGRQEGQRAFETLLLNRQKYQSSLQTIRGAGADLAGQVAALPGTDPTLAVVQMEKRAVAEKEIAHRRFADEALLVEGMKAKWQAKMAEQGAGRGRLAMGATWDYLTGWTWGAGERMALNMLRAGLLDEDEEMFAATARIYGPAFREAKAGMGTRERTERFYRQAGAGQDIKDAAADLRVTSRQLGSVADRMNRPLPTLLRPDDDR